MVACKLGEKGCWNDGKCRLKPCSCENQVVTNADRIRAMNDDALAWQLVQVVREAIKALTDVDLSDKILCVLWPHFLAKLRESAEGE